MAKTSILAVLALMNLAFGSQVQALNPEAERRFAAVNSATTIVQPHVPPQPNYKGPVQPHPRSVVVQQSVRPHPRSVIVQQPVQRPAPVQRTHTNARVITDPRTVITTVPGATQDDLQRAFDSGSSASGRRVTYAKQGNNWFVISGYKDGQIFYQKTRLANDAMRSTVLTYPPSERARMNPVVERLNRSF